MIDTKQIVIRIHEAILRELASNPQQKLAKIVVSCDATETINIKNINEHWRKIATEAQLTGSHIEIQHRQQLVRCILCNREFELDEQTLICPFCHCEQFKIIHKPPVIESYQLHE